jgi:hypothetical protein
VNSAAFLSAASDEEYMTRAVSMVIAGAVLAALGLCQPAIHLKNRDIDTSGVAQSQVRKFGARAVEATGRVHRVVQFTRPPGDDEKASISSAGGTVLAYIHENALLISVDASVALDGLGLQWWGALEPADKISARLPPGTAATPVLIEAHTDVDLADVRALALGVGIELQENPDLAPNQLLARATPDQIAVLASYDAVAYIFPASGDLVAGRPVIACASALTNEGRAGQYIAKMSEGWDGPGLGSAALTYSWGVFTDQLPAAAGKAEIVRAFNEWAKFAQLSFLQTNETNAQRNINVVFGRRDHGDAYPFDGPGGVLAHTFYPAPPNPEPLAGDMHFDDDEQWRIEADMDLFSVALHETGHALGLGHSDRPGSVMYPYYQRADGLTDEDVGAILSLYAAQDATTPNPPAPPSPPVPNPPATPNPPPPAPPSLPLQLSVNAASTVLTDNETVSGTVSGGAGTITTRWTSDRGWSGFAQGTNTWTFVAPLSMGVNTLTITSSDSLNASVTKIVAIARQAPAPAPVPPQQIDLQITTPGSGTAYSVSSPTVPLGGTATYAPGIARVQWSNNRGGSGIASGTANWNAGNIPLADGLNTITVQATATDNRTAARTIQITYSRSTSRDTTAPNITIASPSDPTVLTSATSITVQGTASDNIGVVNVIWFTAAGASGDAIGTTTWSTGPIPLLVGFNTIVVRAFDAAGNMSWRALQVKRQ